MNSSSVMSSSTGGYRRPMRIMDMGTSPTNITLPYSLPGIVGPVRIRQHMVGVDGRGHQRLGGREMQGPNAGLQPGLDGQGNALFRAVLPDELEGRGEGHAIEIFDRDVYAAAARARASRRGPRVFDGDIETPIVEEPFPPKPREVFAGFVLHRPEEIVRPGMAIGPGVDIAAESIIEALFAEDLLAQQDQAQCGFEIDQRM